MDEPDFIHLVLTHLRDQLPQHVAGHKHDILGLSQHRQELVTHTQAAAGVGRPQAL